VPAVTSGGRQRAWVTGASPLVLADGGADVAITATSRDGIPAGREASSPVAGKCLAISSVHARGAAPNLAAYGASKAAVESLVQTAAREWAPNSIRVNALAPGYVATDMTAPLLADKQKNAAILERVAAGRLARPDEVAAGAIYLLSVQATLPDQPSRSMVAGSRADPRSA
jgi:NAD(P)-dependent dehydrogenase (short-subunit alcohol dehydrogenase family)